MTLAIGVSMFRDEADVAEGTIRHLADEVDELIVADNGSRDGTREILDQLSRELPLTVVDDPVIAYHQAQKMTRLAQAAAQRCEERRQEPPWIIPFDADELWFNRGDRIRDVLADASGNVIRVPLFNHFPSSVDPSEGDPFERIIWRQEHPGALPKVAFRWHPKAKIHQGNHGVTHPEPTPASICTVDGRSTMELRHFPHRNEEQFVRKALNGAEAYAQTDLPWHIGQHWREYAIIHEREGYEGLAAVFWEHFHFRSPVDSGLIRDPAPYRRWRWTVQTPGE